jgi:hypothetical protein
MLRKDDMITNGLQQLCLKFGGKFMVTIKVIWESTGKPAKGERVAIGFSGLFGGVTSNEYTDSNGEAHFDVSPGDGEVYVNGSTKYKGRISGRVMVYI